MAKIPDREIYTRGSARDVVYALGITEGNIKSEFIIRDGKRTTQCMHVVDSIYTSFKLEH